LAERDVIAEVVVIDKERYAAEFVLIVSNAHQDMGGRLLARTDDPATFAGVPSGGRMVLVEVPNGGQT
jgi:uncharacterized protein (DUF1330 family)